MVKLFVYKTVKCEIINVEFLSRDLPLNNSANYGSMKMSEIIKFLKRNV